MHSPQLYLHSEGNTDMKLYQAKATASTALPAATLVALQLHKRLQLGSSVTPEQQSWLQSSPERWGLWLEFCAAADRDALVSEPAGLFLAGGVAKPTRDYFYRGLVERGLVERVERGLYRVLV